MDRKPIGLENIHLLEVGTVLVLIRDQGTKGMTKELVSVSTLPQEGSTHIAVSSLTAVEGLSLTPARRFASVHDLSLPNEGDIERYVKNKVQELSPI